MKYITKLNKTFYVAEIDNKYFLTDMGTINKRIDEEKYHKLIKDNI